MDVLREIEGVPTRVDVRCNRCGTSCVRREAGAPEGPSRGWEYGLVEAEVHGGYSSNPLLDMTSYAFSLCEACCAWLFDQCVLPPVIRCEMSGEVTAWERDYRAKHEARVAAWNAVERAALVAALPAAIPPAWVPGFADGGQAEYARADGLRVTLRWNRDHLDVSAVRETPMSEEARLATACDGVAIERGLTEVDVADVRAVWVGDDRPYSTWRRREGPYAGQLLVAAFRGKGDPALDHRTY